MVSRDDQVHSQKEQFGRRVLAALAERGWTYQMAAKRASEFLPQGKRVHAASVWNYAHGRSIPRQAHLDALAQALGIPADALVAATEERGTTKRAPKSAPQDQGVTKASRLELSDAGDGRAHLMMDQEVPWSVAMRILQLLRGETDRD